MIHVMKILVTTLLDIYKKKELQMHLIKSDCWWLEDTVKNVLQN